MGDVRLARLRLFLDASCAQRAATKRDHPTTADAAVAIGITDPQSRDSQSNQETNALDRVAPEMNVIKTPLQI